MLDYFYEYVGATERGEYHVLYLLGGNSSEQLGSNKDWEKIACESRNRVRKQDDKRLI